MSKSFAWRVERAIHGILRHDHSRDQDRCFEMHDGEAVALAIYRRAMQSPALERALSSQWSGVALPDHPWREYAEKHGDADPAELAARLRREGRERAAHQQAEWAAADARAAAQAATEPTEQGLQFVIPGCEKRNDRKAGQLDFWK